MWFKNYLTNLRLGLVLDMSLILGKFLASCPYKLCPYSIKGVYYDVCQLINWYYNLYFLLNIEFVICSLILFVWKNFNLTWNLLLSLLLFLSFYDSELNVLINLVPVKKGVCINGILWISMAWLAEQLFLSFSDDFLSGVRPYVRVLSVIPFKCQAIGHISFNDFFDSLYTNCVYLFFYFNLLFRIHSLSDLSLPIPSIIYED